MQRALTLVAVLLSTGCAAPLPMADSPADSGGKQFAAPPNGRAAVYVFMPAKNAPEFNLSLDQRTLGVLRKSTWLRVDVPAGAHDLRCTSTGLAGIAAMPITTPANSITFIQASWIFFGEPPCRIDIVADDYGRREVLAGARIREVGGASD